MKSQLYVTITILTFGFTSVTSVSNTGYNLHIINALKGNEPIGVTCGETDNYIIYSPPGQPQVTIEHGDRHVWHLERYPLQDFACLLSRNGLKAWVEMDRRFPDLTDKYVLARNDSVYQDIIDLPVDDPRWVQDSQDEYDEEGDVSNRGFDPYKWWPPKDW
ncbi:hypothetical protein POM88_034658 [Heracleum sosnowskyi]|uniref:Uncharacterized protein n=1 Tax=Heracleum sosnowskyi TaxID=360622 RepID=A0AAD8MCJ0_9APIA|nr:hypothetical protein POM88_034651 [Heracleum sosnowskyi]KAK1368566.1 hypothetical protein POM88_034658 [Heracleum sosnowskyi]